MTAVALPAEFARMGVCLSSPAPGRLILSADARDVPAAAIELARRHKAELLALLSGSPGGPCRSHVDASNYRNEPDPRRAGWIRTTCRRCGGFIGYRQ